MRLLSLLKRKSEPAAAASAKPKAGAKASAKASASADAPDSVQQARTRARPRLIGSVVLVVVGVIGFPLLFETQPRPLAVDTPIEIARRDAVAALPAPRPAASQAMPPVPGAVIHETSADAGREVPPPATPMVSGKPESPRTPPEPAEHKPAEHKPVEPKPAPPAAAKPPVVAVAKPTPAKPAPAASAAEKKPAPKPADASRAQALLEGSEAAKKPEAVKKPEAAEAGSRFIVQVGAFSEMPAAREARQKVEKLGLKTYTQVVETSSGNRIRVRVGPFASRAEADKAAGKIKSAGLSSAVFTL